MTEETSVDRAPVDAVVIRDVDQTYGHGVTIDLKPGMAWALYFDDGPSGTCAQSMRVTCPHSVFHVWPNEDAMRDAVSNVHLGRNKTARIFYGVVDEWTSPGVFQVRIHG